MAVPFRRTSKTKKRMRRTHFKLAVEGLVTCPNCGATIKAHNVCSECGFYDGKKVVVTKKAKDESKKAAKAVKEAKAAKEAKAVKETKPAKEAKPTEKESKEKAK